MKDFLGNTIEVGDLVVALPESNARMLVNAKIIEIHDHFATVEYKDRLFDNRLTTARCYPDSIVLVSKFEWPDVCHESHNHVRSSDSSHYGMVCDDCGAADYGSGSWGALRKPCKGVK